jgi:tight adherence protein B
VLGVIILCVFGSVVLLALVIITVINRGLEQYEQRYLEKGSRDLTEMFLFFSPRQILMLTLATASLLSLLGLVIFNWFVALLMGGVGFIVPFFGIRKLRERRIRKFEGQLVDAMVQMSAAFRAGLTLPQAMDNIAQEMPPPLGQEYALTIKELKLGVHQEEALQNMADRVGSEDLQLVVTSTNVARQLGGNMAEMYDIISATIRERFRLEGRIRALTAQGRLQGWVVGAMPLILGLVLNFMRPDLMEPMINSTFGYFLIGIIIVLELIGIWMIRRIVAIDV